MGGDQVQIDLLMAAAYAEANPQAALPLYAQAADAGADDPEFWKNFSFHAVNANSEHFEIVLGRAIACNPDDSELFALLGVALEAAGRPQEAEAACLAAVELNPELGVAWWNLGLIAMRRRQFRDALQKLERAMTATTPFGVPQVERCAHMFAAGFTCGAPGAKMFAWSKEWARLIASTFPAAAAPPPPPNLRRRKLRVGVHVNHPGLEFARSTSAPLLRELLRQGCETYCYGDADMRGTLDYLGGGEVFRDISGLDNQAAAQLVRADRLDLLVTLDFVALGGRGAFWAQRPAPAQLNIVHALFSYDGRLFDALGLDATLYPPECDALFTEPLLRLPVYCAFDPQIYAARRPPRPRAPCADGAPPCFGSFNRAGKIDDAALAFWAAAMAAAPQARLFLSNEDYSHEERRNGVLARLVAAGIAAERVAFRGLVANHDAFLAGYDRVDVALDAVGCSGGLTTLDALMQGVPTVTFLSSPYPSTRTTAAFMNAVGLDALCVATSPEEAGRKAAALVADPEALSALRADLRPRALASPLFHPEANVAAILDWARDWLSQRYPEAA